MSDEALLDSIHVELNMLRACGKTSLLLTPGNYGAAFLKDKYEIDAGSCVKCSNFIGDALEYAASIGFTDLVLVGHIGKLIKLAGGMFQTHSRFGDCRVPIMIWLALSCGATYGTLQNINACVTTDEMLAVLDAVSMREDVMDLAICTIQSCCLRRIEHKANVEVVMFSQKYGVLAKTSQADQLLHSLEKAEDVSNE